MIRFVYFDVGGVIIHDFTVSNKWAELEKEIGIIDSQKFIKFWDKYEPELCIGRNTETLIPLIENQFGIKFPTGYSLLIDGFVKRFEANKSIWPVINKINQKCKIGLLTNMYPQMLTEIEKHNLLPKISWDIIIDSSVVKVQKPDPHIFALAEQKANVAEKEILFVENSPKNINAANNFGWQILLYDSSNPTESNEKLLEVFNALSK